MYRQVSVVIFLASLCCVHVHASISDGIQELKDVVDGKKKVTLSFEDGMPNVSTENTYKQNLIIVAVGVGILLFLICCGVCCKYCCCAKKPPTVIMYQQMPPRNQGTAASGGPMMPMVHRHNGFAEMQNQSSPDITPPPPYPGFKV